MAAANVPLDEVMHCRPDVIQWWLNEWKSPGVPPPFYWMEERFIHRYFTESPFFDWTTKNGLLFGQATSDDTYTLVHSRQPFEAALRRGVGMEYMIVGEPKVITGKDVPPGQKSNVWVIRKQHRDGDKNRLGEFDTTEIRGTYFIINENIYQAPSVADVVGNRMLNATLSLEKMFERAADLPLFSPTTGHTYIPPATNKAAGTASMQGSPARSREGSVAPGMAMDTHSTRSGSIAPDGQAANVSKSDEVLYAKLLGDSLVMATNYGDEYMDENPLVGEPGNFKFTSSTAAVKKRKADEEAAVVAAQKAKEARESASQVASPKPPVKPPTPPPVFTEARATAKTDKDRREEKKRRRKSKAVTGTGTTPTTPKSAGPPAASAAAG